MLEPDCFLRYRGILRRKIPRIRIGGPLLQRGMVLKWFYSLSHRNTFVGGTCGLLSALLVIVILIYAYGISRYTDWG